MTLAKSAWPVKQWVLSMVLSMMVACSYAQAQDHSIIGNLVDSTTGETLTNATVQLMRAKDSVIIRKTASRQDGFMLSRVPSGEFQLLLTYIGYRDTAIFIYVHEKDSVINLGSLPMRKSSGNMMEVVIRAVIPPVIIRNDTVVYNTEAFKTKPNATVAELLKQLPGMEVDREGNLTFQGEKVQKIYVDGKEFFLNDPKLATNNLLADMIQKVEAFNDKSERAKLTGIPDNNPGKAINLRLKPDKKKGLFGTLEAGYGSADRYGIKSTVNQMNGDEFAMATISTSNGGNVQNGYPGLLGTRQTEITLNYRNNFAKNLQLAANYSFNNNSSHNQGISNRETFFTDSSYLQDNRSASASGNYSHNFNTSLNWNIDSLNIINAYASIGINHSQNSSINNAVTDIKRNGAVNHVNNAFTNNANSSGNINGSLSLSYSHVFRKKGRYLGISVSNGNGSNDGQGNLYSLTRFYDAMGWQKDSLERNQRSISDGSSNNLGLNINYTEPIGNSQVLDFSWNINSSSGKSEQTTYNYNSLTGKYDDMDSLASNAFKNTNLGQQFSFGYNYFKGKLKYQAGIGVSKNSQKNTSQDGKADDISQDALNLYPRASMFYTISKEKNLQVNYNGSTRQPSITQLQPLPDYSNPLLVHLGNPLLKQEFSNDLSFNYNYFNRSNAHSFSWRGQVRNTTNSIVNATTTNARGVQEQRYVNVQGNYSASTSINYGLPIGKNRKFGGINTGTSASYSQEVNLVNGQENTKRSSSVNQNVGINYHKDDKLFAGISAGINWSRSSYSIQTMNATNFFTQGYSCNVSYEILKSFSVNSDFSISMTNSQGSLPGRTAKVWNAGALKRLFQNKAELKFTVFDLLNDNKSFNQYMGDNYIESSQQEVMKRVFVLSFMYRFNRMGN